MLQNILSWEGGAFSPLAGAGAMAPPQPPARSPASTVDTDGPSTMTMDVQRIMDAEEIADTTIPLDEEPAGIAARIQPEEERELPPVSAAAAGPTAKAGSKLKRRQSTTPPQVHTRGPDF